MVKAITLAALVLVAGCQTSKGSFCSIAEPIRLSRQGIESLSESDIEQILAPNEKGRRLCGWKR